MGRTTISVVSILLLGCSNQGNAPQVSTRDSAGVRIVESRAPSWQDGEAWTLDDTEAMDLTTTGSGPAHEFYRVVGGTVLADGRIIVVNGGSSEIRAFSRTGTFQTSVGREGEGPGEYRSIRGLIRFEGDTIGVFSWPTNLTLLRPDLTFVRRVRLGDRGRSPRPLDNGRVVDLETYASVLEYEGGEGLIRPPISLVLRDLYGVLMDTVWTGPGFEEYMVPMDDGVSAFRPLFGKGPAFATRGSLVLVGTSEAMKYRVVDLEGRLQEIVRVPDYDLTLPRSSIDAEKVALLGPDPSSRRRRIIENLPAPETFPAYSDFVVDAAGYLWAGELLTLHRWGEPRRWEVFSPDGEWMGPIHTPSDFEVLEIGVDYVLGVFRDELDIEHVQFIPLKRTAEESDR